MHRTHLARSTRLRAISDDAFTHPHAPHPLRLRPERCQATVADPLAQQALVSRRQSLASAAAMLTTAAAADLLAATFIPSSASAAAIKCPGLNGYALSKCLKDARKAAAAEQDDLEGDAESAGRGDTPDDVQDARVKYRQFEQPGELVTLPSGVQYREIEVGTGRQAELGSTCEMSYLVYRLSSGAYFKYSSGGTPVLLFALGFGFEGQRDEGEVYRFRLGDQLSLPAAATPAVVGMKEGGRRRILIPPEYGWISDKVGPRPSTFGGQRRLVAHRDEPLLLEVVLARVRPTEGGGPGEGGRDVQLRAPYKLPAPPSPFGARPA